jgi:hypothetical protein
MSTHEATSEASAAAGIGELSPEWRRAFAWAEATVGGRVVRAERQARWRPAWFLDVERDGEILPLYWRGDRGLEGINSVYDVRYEATFYPILEAHGIPVPHLHGLCNDPLGILLERVPGRANLATAESDAERLAVLHEYMEILARIHAIDPSEFERAGVVRPRDPGAIARGDLEIWAREFHKAKRRPEPMLEFLIGWCRRNSPGNRRETTLVLSDSGQFLFEAGRVTSVIDLELAFLGDPLADLAAMRTRDMAEPMGDLPRAFRHYEKVSGRGVDLQAVRYHSARFNLYTPLTTAHLVADPPPGLDYGLYLAWHIAWARASLDAVAESMGIEVPAIRVPAPLATPRSAATRALVGMLKMPGEGGEEAPFQRYERLRALRTAQLLESAEGLAAELDAEERDEASALLGRPMRNWAATDAALEELVAASPPERDADLLRYFHRRIQREQELYRGAMWEIENAVMRPL